MKPVKGMKWLTGNCDDGDDRDVDGTDVPDWHDSDG